MLTVVVETSESNASRRSHELESLRPLGLGRRVIDAIALGWLRRMSALLNPGQPFAAVGKGFSFCPKPGRA